MPFPGMCVDIGSRLIFCKSLKCLRESAVEILVYCLIDLFCVLNENLRNVLYICTLNDDEKCHILK